MEKAMQIEVEQSKFLKKIEKKLLTSNQCIRPFLK